MATGTFSEGPARVNTRPRPTGSGPSLAAFYRYTHLFHNTTHREAAPWHDECTREPSACPSVDATVSPSLTEATQGSFPSQSLPVCSSAFDPKNIAAYLFGGAPSIGSTRSAPSPIFIYIYTFVCVHGDHTGRYTLQVSKFPSTQPTRKHLDHVWRACARRCECWGCRFNVGCVQQDTEWNPLTRVRGRLKNV